MRDWPIAIWVILGATAIFLGELVYLRVRLWRHEHGSQEATKRLSRFATALRNYANAHGQCLPDTLEDLNLPESETVTYRPCGRLDLDERLILVHDRGPYHKVMEFPALRDGWGVVFCSGRIHVVSEAVLDKLIVADDALRERHELEPVERSPYAESAD